MEVTKQDVFNAAAAIAARGGKPTLNDIRKELSGGRFTMISHAMTEWWAVQKASEVAISASFREPAPEPIACRLNELADEVWEIALQMANERLQRERESLEQTKCEMERVQQDVADLVDAMSADLEAAENTIQQQAESATAAAAEIDRLNREFSSLTHALDTVKHDAQMANAVLAEAHLRVEQLTEMLESEKSDRMNATKKLEQSLVTIAELNANVTELAADLNVMTGRATAAEAKSNQADQALNDVTRKLDKSAGEIQQWQNRAILAESQISSLKQQAGEFKDDAKKAIEDAADLRGKLSAAWERLSALENGGVMLPSAEIQRA